MKENSIKEYFKFIQDVREKNGSNFEVKVPAKWVKSHQDLDRVGLSKNLMEINGVMVDFQRFQRIRSGYEYYKWFKKLESEADL